MVKAAKLSLSANLLITEDSNWNILELGVRKQGVEKVGSIGWVPVGTINHEQHCLRTRGVFVKAGPSSVSE